MSGAIYGGTPWTREAIRQLRLLHPDTLARIEAEIPDGQTIRLFVHGGRYGSWGAQMGQQRTEYGRSTPEAACWAVIHAGVTS